MALALDKCDDDRISHAVLCLKTQSKIVSIHKWGTVVGKRLFTKSSLLPNHNIPSLLHIQLQYKRTTRNFQLQNHSLLFSCSCLRIHPEALNLTHTDKFNLNEDSNRKVLFRSGLRYSISWNMMNHYRFIMYYSTDHKHALTNVRTTVGLVFRLNFHAVSATLVQGLVLAKKPAQHQNKIQFLKWFSLFPLHVVTLSSR